MKVLDVNVRLIKTKDSIHHNSDSNPPNDLCLQTNQSEYKMK